MRKPIRLASTAMALAIGLVAALPIAPVSAQPAYAPLPPPRADLPPPPPPGGREVWIPGHWRWNGVRYVWQHGRYLVRPARYTVWEPERWAMRGGAWVWVPGHWR